MTPTIETSHPARPSPLLRERLATLRQRHVTVAVLTGFSISLVVALELLAVAMFADWWLELPWALRAVSLGAQLGLFGYLLWAFVLTPVLRQPDEEELALMVEKARPEFRSRLIASVQLARPGAIPSSASASLAEALIAETETLAKPGDFRQIVSTDRLKSVGLMAAVIPVIALAGFAAGGETCTALLKRALLSNVLVPRKTRIEVPEGNRTVGIGDTVRLEAFVNGIIPGHGKVEVRFRTRRAQEYPLDQNRENRVQFGRTLENVQESFTYRFSLGDGVSESFEVKAIARPTVAAIECEQHYPAYTGLKNATRSLGDLSLLAGSTLSIKATATKDIQSASIKLVGIDQEIPLRLDTNQPRALAGQFAIPARGLTGFQLQMLDTERMESRDSAVYRVDVLPDKVPQVRITYPDRKEELVTRAATMLVAFDATDDFRIAKVRLKFKVDTMDKGAEKAVELELGNDSQHVRRRYEWKLPDYLAGVTEGSMIEYWLEVEDNNNATGPGVGSSDHQLARVVSDAEKRADLLNRAGDYLGSISDVAGDQEKLNKNLGNIIKAKAGLE